MRHEPGARRALGLGYLYSRHFQRDLGPARLGLLVAPHRRQVEPFMRRHEILRHVATDRVERAEIEKLIGGTAASRDFRFHDNAKFTARHVPNSPSSPATSMAPRLKRTVKPKA